MKEINKKKVDKKRLGELSSDAVLRSKESKEGEKKFQRHNKFSIFFSFFQFQTTYRMSHLISELSFRGFA